MIRKRAWELKSGDVLHDVVTGERVGMMAEDAKDRGWSGGTCWLPLVEEGDNAIECVQPYLREFLVRPWAPSQAV